MNRKFYGNTKPPEFRMSSFNRSDNVPITKEEIRSIVISKLRLKEGCLSIDIGCGSGSISVELAIQTKASVCAIDVDKNAN